MNQLVGLGGDFLGEMQSPGAVVGAHGGQVLSALGCREHLGSVAQVPVAGVFFFQHLHFQGR